MRGILSPGMASLLLLLLVSSCAPAPPQVEMRADCRATATQEELVQRHWLNGSHTWRLRQSALLEMGTRKSALEGFVRLDLKQRAVRLVALNEMGLVVFDLRVDSHTAELMRALPQVREIEGFATGVGASLRRMFLAPRPALEDRLEHHTHYQRLMRSAYLEPEAQAEGEVEFVFDCAGHLHRTQFHGKDVRWQVVYADYRDYAQEDGRVEIPQRIILHNPERRMKLTLNLNEVRRE